MLSVAKIEKIIFILILILLIIKKKKEDFSLGIKIFFMEMNNREENIPNLFLSISLIELLSCTSKKYYEKYKLFLLVAKGKLGALIYNTWLPSFNENTQKISNIDLSDPNHLFYKSNFPIVWPIIGRFAVYFLASTMKKEIPLQQQQNLLHNFTMSNENYDIIFSIIKHSYVFKYMLSRLNKKDTQC